MRRAGSIAVQVAISGGILAFLLWQIDLGRTVDEIASADGMPLLGALAIFLATTVAMAWRWQFLLRAKGIDEPLGWLTNLYFVGYAAGQVLPTAVGGDAVRIVDHSRRRPDAKGEVAAAVLFERVLGAAGTLLLVAVGLAVAAGRYEGIGILVAVEAGFVAATLLLAVLLFSRRLRGRYASLVPLARRLRIERPARSLYVALHGYRDRPAAVGTVLGATLAIQLVRIVAIWLCGVAVGIDLSILAYVILGPLLFLVMMVPFTINGLGVREAFFVAFLGRFGVDADAAFAAGFLFYAVTLATSLPGALVLLWRSVRPAFVRTRAG